MRRGLVIFLWLCLIPWAAVAAQAADEEIIPPAYPVPDYVEQLLAVAREELGYAEGAKGYTKYGDWAGEPNAQWCAEFLCWCVDQVDKRYGTQLLTRVYPLYSGSNTGRAWFIAAGRYLVRNGHLEGWGYQWFKGEDHYMTRYEYIPQPGDWMFFTWTSGTDTDHVAMVEYCTRDAGGKVSVHVIEGNNPSAVARNVYPLENMQILGYGTVHDVCDWTMRSGNAGEKVRSLQEQLIYLGYLAPGDADGAYGGRTANAVRAFQAQLPGKKRTGIADLDTQAALTEACAEKFDADPANWIVVDDPQEPSP